MLQTLSKTKANTMTLPSGRVLTLPTDGEEAQIDAGIALTLTRLKFVAAHLSCLT